MKDNKSIAMMIVKGLAEKNPSKDKMFKKPEVMETEESDESDDVSVMGPEAAAEDIMQAIKDNDAKGLMTALKDFIDCCGENTEFVDRGE